MALMGKGFWIWKIRDCEGGDPQAIAKAAKSSGYTHVMIKIADGAYAYNIDPQTKFDRVPDVVSALRQQGLAVWGWQYTYGAGPNSEANIAIQRIRQFDLDGFVIDAEQEYKESGKAAAAKTYASKIRSAFPNLPLALSSYRFPSYHPQFPWKAFLEYVDINMPQVYWEKAHNPDAQMQRVMREFKALTPYRPVFPTGPGYKVGGWAPTLEDTVEFLDVAKKYGCAGANFFSWDECRAYLPKIWDTIAGYNWEAPVVSGDLTEQFIAALNSRDAARVTGLYHPDAVHITYARAIKGADAIRNWYQEIFTSTLPNAQFTLMGSSGTGSSRHLNWTAQSSRGQVNNGNDTFGIMDGKIAYHYSSFTVSAAAS
jgi:hypothetical protein